MEGLALTAAALGVFAFLVWAAQQAERLIHLGKPKLKHANFKVHEIPLSPEQWKRFCHLAEARGTNQKRLIADAITAYLEEKTK
jgi:hypothetical protein